MLFLAMRHKCCYSEGISMRNFDSTFNTDLLTSACHRIYSWIGKERTAAAVSAAADRHDEEHQPALGN
jgi:hypothetical protein